MPPFINLAGQRFGRLVVICEAGRNKHGKVLWKCRCDCGNEKITHTQNLRSGLAKSCGCWNREINTILKLKHGHTRKGKRTPEYRSWTSMINRCENPNCPDYKEYGGRGIKVCERWRNSFENFLADMGPRPSPKHSIDRIDVNGDYEPSNCRWATPSEQTINQRLRSDNKSGHKGVVWEEEKRRWRAYIGINGKLIRLGTFKDMEKAIQARKRAEIEYFGKMSS